MREADSNLRPFALLEPPCVHRRYSLLRGARSSPILAGFHKQTIAVVSCHLAADKNGKVNNEKRLEDVRCVLEGLQLEYDGWDIDVQNACHHVVLLGDLNFRIAMPVATAARHLHDGNGTALFAADELQSAMKTQRILHGFREAASPAAFMPSFRRIEGARVSEAEASQWKRSNRHLLGEGAAVSASSSDAVGEDRIHFGSTGPTAERIAELYSLAASDGTERTPSWTDRVLLHSLPGLQNALTCDHYSLDESLTISDHRPVSATLRLVCDITDPSTLGGSLRCTVRLSQLSAVGLGGEDGAIGAGEGADAVKEIEVLLPLPSEMTGNALKRVESILGEVREDLTNPRIAWDTAARDGIVASAEFDGHSRAHALIKVLGTSGFCLGETVIEVGDQTAKAVALEWPLTARGQLVGMLRAECQVVWGGAK